MSYIRCLKPLIAMDASSNHEIPTPWVFQLNLIKLASAVKLSPCISHPNHEALSTFEATLSTAASARGVSALTAFAVSPESMEENSFQTNGKRSCKCLVAYSASAPHELHLGDDSNYPWDPCGCVSRQPGYTLVTRQSTRSPSTSVPSSTGCKGGEK